MRLWTIHPKYLDAVGLVALWRETLLAQAVLRGRTVGYRNHPQLERFRSHDAPVACVASYLRAVYQESVARSYRFDHRKLGRNKAEFRLTETEGQLMHEWEHLKKKLRARSPDRYQFIRDIASPEPHPLFEIVPGDVRPWERSLR
jgi:hypothetical protein